MKTDPQYFGDTRVIPVLAIEQVEDCIPLAEALLKGGLPFLEVTLRTSAALDVISTLAKQLPEAHVGVGSVRTVAQLELAISAGAQFAVSPGVAPDLLEAAASCSIPFLPGAATPSEVMTLLAAGFDVQKFFPAEINGGVKALKAFAGPLSEVRFCPTGGVGPKNLSDYLALPNVICVGGSWMVPNNLLAEKNWSKLQELAAEAVTLARQ